MSRFLGATPLTNRSSIKISPSDISSKPAIIRSVLKKSLKELSLREEEASARSLLLAQRAYVYWDQSTNYDNSDRRRLQTFPILYRDEIFNFMTDPAINPMAKARLWSQLKFEDQQRVYDYLDEYFTALCDAVQPPWDEGRAFPEPPGMEGFRRQEQKLRGAARVEGVDQVQFLMATETVGHAEVMKSIEMFGKHVIPAFKKTV